LFTYQNSLHDFSVMVIGSTVDTRTACSEMFKTADKRKKKSLAITLYARKGHLLAWQSSCL